MSTPHSTAQKVTRTPITLIAPIPEPPSAPPELRSVNALLLYLAVLGKLGARQLRRPKLTSGLTT